MIAVIQRVFDCSVNIDGNVKDQIDYGLLVLLGIEEADGKEDIQWLSKKIANLRIFNDDDGVMNKSCIEVNGQIMVISQFTLHASIKKGNRPSYIKAAKPETAIPLYNLFVSEISGLIEKRIATGEFGADMKVSFTNDGPVTILIDTKDKK